MKVCLLALSPWQLYRETLRLFNSPLRLFVSKATNLATFPGFIRDIGDQRIRTFPMYKSVSPLVLFLSLGKKQELQ